ARLHTGAVERPPRRNEEATGDHVAVSIHGHGDRIVVLVAWVAGDRAAPELTAIRAGQPDHRKVLARHGILEVAGGDGVAGAGDGQSEGSVVSARGAVDLATPHLSAR